MGLGSLVTSPHERMTGFVQPTLTRSPISHSYKKAHSTVGFRIYGVDLIAIDDKQECNVLFLITLRLKMRTALVIFHRVCFIFVSYSNYQETTAFASNALSADVEWVYDQLKLFD